MFLLTLDYNFWPTKASGLLPRTKRCDHTTLVLASLHKLPVCFRFYWFCWDPSCPCSQLHLRLLSNACSSMCLENLGQRCFICSSSPAEKQAPRLWNDLPEEIRLAKLVIFLISCLWHTLFCILTCFSIVFMAFNLTYLLILTECKFAFKMIFFLFYNL